MIQGSSISRRVTKRIVSPLSSTFLTSYKGELLSVLRETSSPAVALYNLGTGEDTLNNGDARPVQTGRCIYGDSTDDVVTLPVPSGGFSDLSFYCKFKFEGSLPEVSEQIRFFGSVAGTPNYVRTNHAADWSVDSSGSGWIANINRSDLVEDRVYEYLVTVVQNGTDADFAAYLDGALVYSNTESNFTLGGLSPSGLQLLRYVSTSYSANTKMTDVRIFTAGKTPADIAANSTQDMWAWYKLDDAAGTVARDSSGNGNDGTYDNITPATFHVEDNSFPSFQNSVGYSEGAGGALIPRDESNTSLDVLGNPLQYKGRVPLNLTVTGAVSGDYLTSDNTIAFPSCPEIEAIDSQFATRFFYSSLNGAPNVIDAGDIVDNYEFANMVLADTDNPNQIKNLALFNPALTGTDLETVRKLLTKAPTTLNMKLASIGDSLIESAFFKTGDTEKMESLGISTWLRALTGQYFTYDPNTDNYGVGGDTAVEVAARVTDLAASAPDAVIVWMGINSPNNGDTLQEMKDSLDTVVDYITNTLFAQAWVISPYNKGNHTASDIEKIAGMHAHALQKASSNSLMTYFDITGDTEMFDSDIKLKPAYNRRTTSSPYAVDEVHINTAGAHRIVTQYMLPTLFSGVTLPDYPTSLAGNLLTNPDFSGTGGTIPSDFQGTTADDWLLQKRKGTFSPLITMSKDGNDFLNMVADAPSGGDGDSEIRIYESVGSAAYGKTLQGLAHMTINSGVNLGQMKLEVQYRLADGSTSLYIVDMDSREINSIYDSLDITTPTDLVLRTPVFTVPADATGCWFWISFGLNASAADASVDVTLKFAGLAEV